MPEAPSSAPLSLADLRSGGKVALARALARWEETPDSETILDLLSECHAAPTAAVIGLTGPPGVGKSTLMDALIRQTRAEGRTVGCIAVDPSSRRSGGALLGDRTRISTDPEDQGVFVRSMAARDRLGGLAAQTVGAMVLMRALFDLVLIETVGVGQSETDIADMADLVLFCVQPGAGDDLQYMKAGIAEIPDIVVVTKADLGAVAQRAQADVKGGLGLSVGAERPVLLVSAADSASVTALTACIAEQWRLGTATRPAKRHRQAEIWLSQAIRERYGSLGLARAGDLSLAPNQSPFRRLRQIAEQLA